MHYPETMYKWSRAPNFVQHWKEQTVHVGVREYHFCRKINDLLSPPNYCPCRMRPRDLRPPGLIPIWLELDQACPIFRSTSKDLFMAFRHCSGSPHLVREFFRRLMSKMSSWGLLVKCCNRRIVIKLSQWTWRFTRFDLIRVLTVILSTLLTDCHRRLEIACTSTSRT